MTDLVCVGAIAGAFGVRGEVRLKSFCADPAAIASYGPLVTEDGARSFEVTLGPPVSNGFAARLDGIASKEAAEALKGTRLYVARARLPDPEEEEYYHADLLGLDVVDTGGARIGRIAAVLNHGATDLLEITIGDTSRTILLPFTRAVVPSVDPVAGRIVVDPPEGSLS